MNTTSQSQRLTGYRAVIPFYLLYDLELNGNHFRLYGQIEQMESHPNSGTTPTFSYQWIANLLGMARRNAIGVAKKLKQKGYIEHIQLDNGNWMWRTIKKPIIKNDSDVEDHLGSTSDTQDHPGSDVEDHFASDTEHHPKYQKNKIQKYKYIKPIGTSSKMPCNSNEDFLNEEESQVAAAANLDVRPILSNEWELMEALYNQRYGADASTLEKASDPVVNHVISPNHPIPITKSDYYKNQITDHNLDNKDKKTINLFTIKDIQENNSFSIPEQALIDWISNRKKKKIPLTPTAWRNINRELAKCKEEGIDPVQAFEEMVGNGWQSLKLEYFKKPTVYATAHRWTVDSVMRA